MTDTERPDWLEKHLAALPRELVPPRDLWPGTEKRLRASPRRLLIPASIAAGLAIGAVALVITGQLEDRDAAREAVAIVELPPPQEGSDPWEPARARYAQDWPAIREQIGPETAAVIERNLEIIRRANVDLQIALERQPDNPALRRLLRQTLAKEIDVYKRAWEASRQVAAGTDSGPAHWRGSLL